MDWRSWWQELAVSGVGAAAVRWLYRRRPPADGPGPLQRFLQWAQSAKRAEATQAGNALLQEQLTRIEAYADDLVLDLEHAQARESALRAENRRLRDELDSFNASAIGSTATPTARTQRPRPPSRRSIKRRRSKSG
jgi:hypothetical protein